ncbi:hypothetical protein GCM10022247_57220 [Allokutzneria multivorans]|uniref:Uncharacterized protein n=1 Tax=Allokutzneria multivorans TaxID=1142134 RepID=A0ABP7TGD6_9PSEU
MKISSGAYATEDKASEAKTGNAIRFGRSVCASRSLRNGRPSRRRFAAVANLDTRRRVFGPVTKTEQPWVG